jgi:hypothetical protein
VTRVASTSGGSSSGVVSATLNKPAGVVAGDVLVAQITVDGDPAVTPPAGWTAVTNQALNTNARLVAFYRVAGTSEPASYRWSMSASRKWNGGITAFHGVNTTSPFEGVVTGSNPTTAATTLTLPGASSSAPGSMVVGGVGLNGTAMTVTPPTGWDEAFEGTNGQVTEFAWQARPSTGATGPATWTFSTAIISVGWMGVLRPV